MTAPALLLPLTLLIAIWARLSLRFAGGPLMSRTQLIGTGAAGATGYAGILLAIRIGSETTPVEVELALSVFGALLLIAAWTDQRTAWAPDGVMVPLLIGGASVAGLLGTIPFNPLLSVGVAVGLFLLAQVAWGFQGWAGYRVLPPPDLMVLTFPVLLFGLTLYAPLTYLTLSALLIFLLRAPEPVYLILRGPAALEARSDAGLSGSGRTAPLLPVALGSVYLLLLFRLSLG